MLQNVNKDPSMQNDEFNLLNSQKLNSGNIENNNNFNQNNNNFNQNNNNNFNQNNNNNFNQNNNNNFNQNNNNNFNQNNNNNFNNNNNNNNNFMNPSLQPYELIMYLKEKSNDIFIYNEKYGLTKLKLPSNDDMIIFPDKSKFVNLGRSCLLTLSAFNKLLLLNIYIKLLP